MDMTNDILERLKNGESVETIAAELTKSINDANTQFEAAKRAEAEAQAKAEAENAKFVDKFNAIDDLISILLNMATLWGVDEELLEELENVTDSDIEEIVKSIDKLAPLINSYISANKQIREKLAAMRPETAPPISAKDPIEEFLNTFVR